LWNDLTVVEHLLFYARLKGVAPDQEESMVRKALEEV
jgi:ABC-type multidrug transport system ATPase subunit